MNFAVVFLNCNLDTGWESYGLENMGISRSTGISRAPGNSLTWEFPRLKLFPPVSRETGISRGLPARGFPLNITVLVFICWFWQFWRYVAVYCTVGACTCAALAVLVACRSLWLISSSCTRCHDSVALLYVSCIHGVYATMQQSTWHLWLQLYSGMYV